MTGGRDGAGHRYIEFEMSGTEHIRVTHVPFASWAGGPTVRIQKRAYTGRVSPGPEFSASKADDLIEALRELLR